MASNLIPSDTLRNLDPYVVESYATATGWERVLGVPSNVALFQREDSSDPDDYHEIIIPIDRSFADFSERMADVVEGLGRFERRSPIEILAGVLRPSDILRFRVVSPETVNGVLPFLEGVDLFNGMRQTFLSAASDLLVRQAYHPRMARQEARTFLKGCHLGQTMVGSYVATVICPIDPTLDTNRPKSRTSSNQKALFPELPHNQFNRGVTARIMQSCEIIKTRLDRGDVDYLVSPPDSDIRISGNFFDALVEMQSDQIESSLDISVSWSSTLAINQDVPSSVLVPESYFPEIEKIANRLRPSFKSEPREFFGKVIALAGEENENNLMEGEVIIRFDNDDDLSEARVVLEADDYVRACDAHRDGSYVRLFGVLDRMRRRYIIHSPQYFEIVAYRTFGNKMSLANVKRAKGKIKRFRQQP